jgi:hypothetical protein
MPFQCDLRDVERPLGPTCRYLPYRTKVANERERAHNLSKTALCSLRTIGKEKIEVVMGQ